MTSYPRSNFLGTRLILSRLHGRQVDSQDWYPPSEAYCCAILRNLGGSFPGITKLSLRCTGGPENVGDRMGICHDSMSLRGHGQWTCSGHPSRISSAITPHTKPHSKFQYLTLCQDIWKKNGNIRAFWVWKWLPFCSRPTCLGISSVCGRKKWVCPRLEDHSGPRNPMVGWQKVADMVKVWRYVKVWSAGVSGHGKTHHFEQVGIRKKRPWVMPRGIGQIRQHLLERKISCGLSALSALVMASRDAFVQGLFWVFCDYYQDYLFRFMSVQKCRCFVNLTDFIQCFVLVSRMAPCL